MASSSRARRSTSSADAHSSYQSFVGIEKATIGVGKIVQFDMERHAHIHDYLAEAGILSIITPDSFSSVLVREFYNHLEDPMHTDLNGGVMSRVQRHTVTITHEDLRNEFGLVEVEFKTDIVESYRKDRDWTLMNLALHGDGGKNFIQTTSSLTADAQLVQEILRNTVMLKAGDTKSVTAQLSLITYYILEREPFDIADFVLSLMRHTYRFKNPNWKKINNLPMGAIIQRILFTKYQWIAQDMYATDCFPSIFNTEGSRFSKGKSAASSSMRHPPIPRGGSLRDSIDNLTDAFEEHRKSFEEHKEESKKRWSMVQKFMKFVSKGLKHKPTPAEAAQWEDPEECDPPRHSIRRTRRSRETGDSSSANQQGTSG